jgi:hydroxyacylglutathione hydrolase
LLGVAPAARTVAQPAADAQVLDVRDGEHFADGHIAGSFNDAVSAPGFGNRCGFALDPEREVVIVATTHEEAGDAARKLAAVGFTQLAEIGFGLDSAHALERFEPVGLEEMGTLAAKGDLQVIDVREASEQTQLAAGALKVPYRLLASADLSALDPARPTAVVCHTGVRAPLAASLLARRGFTHVRPVLSEGMGTWHAPEEAAAAHG